MPDARLRRTRAAYRSTSVWYRRYPILAFELAALAAIILGFVIAW